MLVLCRFNLALVTSARASASLFSVIVISVIASALVRPSLVTSAIAMEAMTSAASALKLHLWFQPSYILYLYIQFV